MSVYMFIYVASTLVSVILGAVDMFSKKSQNYLRERNNLMARPMRFKTYKLAIGVVMLCFSFVPVLNTLLAIGFIQTTIDRLIGRLHEKGQRS